MATKDDTTKAAPGKAATPAKPAEPAVTPKGPAKAAAEPKDEQEAKPERVSTCVVNDGQGMHVGDAVNGMVCSYHAMHYDAHGNRR